MSGTYKTHTSTRVLFFLNELFFKLAKRFETNNFNMPEWKFYSSINKHCQWLLDLTPAYSFLREESSM